MYKVFKLKIKHCSVDHITDHKATYKFLNLEEGFEHFPGLFDQIPKNQMCSKGHVCVAKGTKEWKLKVFMVSQKTFSLFYCLFYF